MGKPYKPHQFLARNKKLIRQHLNVLSVFLTVIVVATVLITTLFQSDAHAAGGTSGAGGGGVVETNFFGNIQDDGGCGVFVVLNLILDILTYGIAIAATIGIVISGVNYLTASGDEQKTTKAKRRIFEIVIGLAVYTVLYFGAQWLLPGGDFNSTTTCTTISDEELAKRRAEEQASKKTNSKTSDKTKTSDSKKENNKKEEDPLKAWYDAMTKQYNWSKNQKYEWTTPSVESSRTKGTCVTFPIVSLQRLGLLSKGQYFWYDPNKNTITGTGAKVVKNRKDIFSLSYPHKTIKELNKAGKIKKGDIIGFDDPGNHTMVFMGFNKKGNPIFNTMGHNRGLKITYPSYANRKVDMLIHLKKTSKK
jgi:hypothetical protein